MIWFYLSMAAFICIFASSLIIESIEFSFYWHKGLIPPWRRDHENTRIQVYIALAALLLGNNRIESHPKLQHLYKFILRNKNGRLPMSERNSYFKKVRSMLAYAKNHPIRLDAVHEWFARNEFSLQKKLQVIRFMADFALINGKIHPREMAVIAKLAGYSGITDAQLEELIEKLKQQEKEESKQQPKPAGTQKSEYARCCAVLGVSKEADLKTVKKAYRKLAQASHPDRFANASKAAHDAAQQRFIEIKRAYETLEKMISGKH